jgi:uncharacterized protein (TIRG00374 family)
MHPSPQITLSTEPKRLRSSTKRLRDSTKPFITLEPGGPTNPRTKPEWIGAHSPEPDYAEGGTAATGGHVFPACCSLSCFDCPKTARRWCAPRARVHEKMSIVSDVGDAVGDQTPAPDRPGQAEQDDIPDSREVDSRSPAEVTKTNPSSTTSASRVTSPTSITETAVFDSTTTQQFPVEANQLKTLVVEDGVVTKRLRRPLDLARLLLAVVVIAAIQALALFATGTAVGLGEDIEEASRQLPGIIVLVLNVVGGLGLLTLPVAAAVDLLIRGRGRQLLDALLALFVAVVSLTAAMILINNYGSLQLILSLAGSTKSTDSPLFPLLGGLMAFITTARLMSRGPWAAASTIVVSSLFAVTIITGGSTLAGISISIVGGWAIGLAVRYALGTLTTRPSGQRVAETLAAADLPVTVLKARETTAVGRRYSGIQLHGPELEVFVLDRDLEGAGLAQSIWKSLRLREDSGRRSFNMRDSLQQRALMAYAAGADGIPAAKLVAAREVGPDASLLAYERVNGTRLADLTAEDLSDAALEEAWRLVGSLRKAAIAHRRLTADNLVLTPQGEIRILGLGNGTIAASDVMLRIDSAEMLCTLGLIVGAERAVESGRRALGNEVLSKALPVLQPVALSSTTKRALRKDKGLLVELRDSLLEIAPNADTEKIELERFKPRTLIMVVLGSIAAYFLFAQLAQVDFGTLFANASWWWAAIAAVPALLTYPGAAWSLTGFVPEKIKLWRTILAQLAGDFATLVTPPTLGAIAINLRYLQKAGIHPALATASIGVAQVAALIVHIILLLGFGVAAGTQQDFSFKPPMWAVLIVAGTLIAAGALFLLAPIRRLIWKRIGPLLKQVGPRMVTVAQTPSKILEGVGGMLLLNFGYILCLAACIEAFGGDLSIAAIAVVYLTGSVIGQAAPTPGGLGAVEAAMAAGLTAAGLDAGLALSAVLLFRVITFWIPTVPGWFAFNWLQKKNYL